MKHLLVIILALAFLVAAAPPRPIPPVRQLPHTPSPHTPSPQTPTPPTDDLQPSALHTPYPAAPPCPHHDTRAYHGLWDAARGCHHDHTHGDDPHNVDDIFGTDYYQWAGGEISYPWHTPNENAHKHGAYMWFVRRDLPCETATGPCITAFRAQFHGVGAAHGAVTSFHSAWLEAQVCAGQPRQCGIVRVGGWQGPVDLNIDGRVVLAREDSGNRFFIHYYDSGNRAFGTWYTGAQNGMYSIIPQFEDMWNTVPPAAEAGEIVAASRWFCAGESGAYEDLQLEGCAANSSRVQPHIIRFVLPQRTIAHVDGDGDGLANFAGYVQRHGELAPHCTAPGPECIPFQLQDVPYTAGEFQYRGQAREYDICFDANDQVAGDCRQARPSGWIHYPIH